MIDQLFTLPLQEIHEHQEELNEEINKKNKQLKELFSKKYQELLDCSTLLSGINTYTNKIIQLTDKSQELINHLGVLKPEEQQNNQKQGKVKGIQIIIKRMNQLIEKKQLYLCSIIIQHFIQNKNQDWIIFYSYQEHLEKYPTDQSTFVDKIFIYKDRLDVLFQQIQQECLQKLDNLVITQSFSNLKQSQLLHKYLQYNLNEQVVNDILNLKEPNIREIDQKELEDLLSQLELHIEKFNATMNQKIIEKLQNPSDFDIRYYQYLFQGSIVQTDNEKKEIWLNWVEYRMAQIQQKTIKQFKGINIDDQLKSQVEVWQKIVIEAKNIILELETYNDEMYFPNDTKQIIQNNLQKIQDVINRKQYDSFQELLLNEILLTQWNNHNYFKIDLNQQKEWSLNEINETIGHQIKEFKEIIDQVQLILIIKKYVKDHQFSLEYRNIALMLFQEEIKTFYQNIFQQKGFNNKELKRLALPVQNYNIDQNYSIFPQKDQKQIQLGTWTQAVKKPDQQPPQKQASSRFGNILGWNRQQ
ncbi:hypothetical protein pb186bvf_010135 [Paramecium bursaria]